MSEPSGPCEFVIPFAEVRLDDGTSRRIAPYDGRADGTYYCPDCSERVCFRRPVLDGEGIPIRRQHFAHIGETSCEGGRGEGQLHRTAKMLVAQRIGDWLAGHAARPVFALRCPSCVELIARPIEARIVQVGLEQSLPASGRRPDVRVTLDDRRTAAIEICHTHEVDEAKRGDLKAECAWWIELEAHSILDGQEDGWLVRASSLPIVQCLVCQDRARQESESKYRQTRDKLDATEQKYRVALEQHRVAAENRDRMTQEFRSLETKLQAFKDQRDKFAPLMSDFADLDTAVWSLKTDKARLEAEMQRSLHSYRADVEALGQRAKQWSQAVRAWLPENGLDPIEANHKVFVIDCRSCDVQVRNFDGIPKEQCIAFSAKHAGHYLSAARMILAQAQSKHEQTASHMVVTAEMESKAFELLNEMDGPIRQRATEEFRHLPLAARLRTVCHRCGLRMRARDHCEQCGQIIPQGTR